MQTYSVAGWRVINRREAIHALRVIVGGVGRDPLPYALHSGRIGGATQSAAQGTTNVQIQGGLSLSDESFQNEGARGAFAKPSRRLHEASVGMTEAFAKPSRSLLEVFSARDVFMKRS